MPNFVSRNLKKRAADGFFLESGAVFKLALYQAALNPTAAYVTRAAQHEAAGGNYAAGGVTVSNVAVTLDGDNYRVTFDNPTWTNLGSGTPLTYRYAVLYRSDIATDNVACGWDAGGDRVLSGQNESIEFGTGSNAPLSVT